MHKLLPRPLLVGALFGLLLAPSSDAQAAKRKTAEDPAIVRQAMSLAVTDRNEAISVLEEYLKEGSNRELLATVALYLGEQHRLNSDPVAAREGFDLVRSDYGDEDAADFASLGLALLDYAESPSGNTLATLDFLPEKNAPPTMNADRYRILALEAEAAEANTKEIESLARKSLGYAAADPVVESRANRDLAHLLPDETKGADELADIPQGAGADAAAIERARKAMYEGDFARAQKQAQAVLDNFPDSPYALHARWIRAQASAGDPYEPLKVGVLLPLSGTYAPPGGQIRQALEYAARGSGVELVFRDTAGDPDKAVEQFEGLVLDHGVSSVIGPLLKDNAMAVAPEAQAAEVPLITLTQTAGITGAGEYIFRGGVTSAHQIEDLTDFSMGQLGHRTFAIFAPSNAYGSTSRDAFKAAVEERGGQITRVVMYDPGKNAFGAEAGELQAMDFDAIFVPDNWQRVAMVASSMAYAELAVGGFSPGFKRTPVPLLGLNGWHNQSLAEQGGQYIQNCYFVDVFDGEEGPPEQQSFAAGYEGSVGHMPGVLEALAYDSALIAFDAAREQPKNRAILRDYLASAKVQGTLTGGSFDEAREIPRRMMVYVIREENMEKSGDHVNTRNTISRID